MTITTQKYTFTEYLNYSDRTNTRYELVNGELVKMALGTGRHGAIAKFLERIFDEESSRQSQPWTAQRFALGVRSPRGGRWDTSRIPDVVVLPLEQWEELANREAVIELSDPPPILVVEVVSDSTQDTDYRSKRSEYAVLEIGEYWIVDPQQEQVTIGLLESGFYNTETYQGEERVISRTFPNLTLTATQILTPHS